MWRIFIRCNSILIGMLVVSCAGTVQFGLQDKPVAPTPFVDAFKQLPEGAVRDSLNTLLIMFQYTDTTMYWAISKVDPVANPGLLEQMLRDFKARKDLETFRGDTPDRCEWWEEFWEKRAAYCLQHFRTSFFGKFLEPMRTEAVLKNGIPDDDSWIDVPCFALRSTPATGECQVNELDWVGKGIYLAYEADADGEIARMVPSSKTLGKKRDPSDQLFSVKEDERKFVSQQKPQFSPFQEKIEPLSASLVISSFPDSTGWYDLYLASRIPLKQLMRGDSLVQLTATANFYTQAGTLALPTDSVVRAYPASTPALDQRQYTMVRQYRLPAGAYSLWYTVTGKEDRYKGIFTVPVEFPSGFTSKPAISELMLLEELPGTNTYNRVVRNGMGLLPRMSDVYAPGDTVYVYAEFDLSRFPKDNFGNYEYAVDVTMKGPIKPNQDKGKVIVGESMPVLDQKPDVSADMRQRIARRIFFGEPLTSLKQPRGRKARDWYCNQAPIVLGANLKEGKYILRVFVYSLLGEEEFYSWREIEIKKP